MIQTIKDLVSAKADTTVALAREIWDYAELSYEETKSAAALVAAARSAGQPANARCKNGMSQLWWMRCAYPPYNGMTAKRSRISREKISSATNMA